MNSITSDSQMLSQRTGVDGSANLTCTVSAAGGGDRFPNDLKAVL